MSYSLLEIEQLLQLHAQAIAFSGGSAGVRDMGRLDAAHATQLQEVFGAELYPTIWLKAAAIIRGIVGDHPFVDGNKRTAMLAGLTLLELNGCRFRGKKGDVEDFAVKIAVERLSVEQIAHWLEEHSVAASR